MFDARTSKEWYLQRTGRGVGASESDLVSSGLYAYVSGFRPMCDLDDEELTERTFLPMDDNHNKSDAVLDECRPPFFGMEYFFVPSTIMVRRN